MDKKLKEMIDLAARLSQKSGMCEEVKKVEQIVFNSKDPEANYSFACFVKGSDVNAHAQIVLDSKDPQINYIFARYVKGADKKVHEQVVIDSKNAEYNYRFAKCVKGADIKAHEKVVLESKSPVYNFWFARDIRGADKKAHGQVLIDLNTDGKEDMHTQMFANHFPKIYVKLINNDSKLKSKLSGLIDDFEM